MLLVEFKRSKRMGCFHGIENESRVYVNDETRRFPRLELRRAITQKWKRLHKRSESYKI